MSIREELVALLRRSKKTVLLWVGLGIAGVASFSLWDFLLPSPPFLLQMGEQLAADPKVIRTIGEQTGSSYFNSQQDLAATDTATFSCTITGKCDSAYWKVVGYYYKRGDQLIGVPTDTIVKTDCR
jgi:hypothetical protein